MLHTEPPYSNYGTKIFGVQTGRIETRHLFSVDGQRVMLVSSFIGGNGGFDWGSGNTYKNYVLKFDLEEYNWTIYGGMDAYRRHHAVELVNYADFLPYVTYCYQFWS